MTDMALEALSKRFDEMYAKTGRPSIPPEQLLRALLLQALYSVRSERMLVEQLENNLLFRWFVGLGMNNRAWNHAVFSKNRERLLAGDVAEEFFACVVEQARTMRLLSDEHFTVDGTLIEAWASHKSFRPKDGSDDDGEGGFPRQQAAQRYARSTTDPEAKLYRKGNGQEAKLSYLGHVVIDNRHGLAVDATLTEANGRASARRRWRWRRGCRRGSRDVGRGQGLRRAGLRGGFARTGRDAARGAERERAPQPHRRENDAARRV